MNDEIIRQLSEVFTTLFENVNKLTLQEALQINPESDEEQIKYVKEFITDVNFFIKALNRNRGLVKSLIPNIFQMISELSVFDVKLNVESKQIFSQIENLNNICKNLADEFKNVAKSQDENQQALNQNSLLLKSSSDDIININNRMKEEMDLLEQVKGMLDDLTIKSDDIVKETDVLLSINKRIADTIGGIKTVADHTTLLALNASIEAARAGVAGKGFAVIAQEIRTLSGNTKKLVNEINDLLREVGQASESSKKSISAANLSIKQIDETAETLYNNTKINSDETQLLTENIKNIYEYSENMLTRTQETANVINESVERVGNIYEIVQIIHESSDMIKETGVLFSKTMDASGANMTEISGNLMQTKQMGISNDEFNAILIKAVEAHNGWVNTLKDIVKGMKLLPIQLNEQKCSFGRYYNAIMPVHSSVSGIWANIGPVHINLHKNGDLIIQCVEKGDSASAERILKESLNDSTQITKYIEEVMKVTKGLKVSVFKRG